MFFLTSREKRLLPARTFDVNEKLYLAVFLYPFEEDGTNSPALKILMHPGLKPFELSLKENQTGKKVAAKKAFIAEKPDVPRSMSEFERMRLVSVNNYSLRTRSLPSVAEAFDIKTNGVFTLEVRVSVCVPLTNGVPDYRAMAAKGAPREPLGLLRSDPIYVTITK